MKKQFLLLTFIALLLFSNRITAQAFNFSVTPQNLCLNSNAIAVVTATAPLASTYTWVVAAPGLSQAIVANAAPNGSAVSITFTACGIYTVACFAFTTGSIQVGQVTNTVFVSCNTANTPTIISTAANSTLCSGSSVTLTGIGGTTYTWFPGSITGPSIVVTPVSNTCYTLVASNVGACNSMSTSCLGVLPSPTVVVSGNGTVCAGGSLTLTLIGALSYTLSPPGITVGGSVIITPSVTGTYTVDGCGFVCCAPSTIFGATVTPAPNIVIAGSNTVCSGSSVTYTATGANTYTWLTNPPVYNSTLNVLPTSNTNYQVLGNANNGCGGSAIASLTVDTSCSNVWPGDANRDGVVSNTDVFEIGLAFNATGPARTTTSNAWASQFANNWTGTISTGWNRNHADCNGNGTINNADTVAIFNNFSLTHAFKASENNAVNPDITLTLPASVYAGQWNKADILLGSASAPISQLYGIAFDLGIDQTLLDNNSAYLLYSPSFLNANNQNVEFRKNNLTNGIIHAASVRVDGNNSNGHGKIGELWFKISATAPNNALLNLSVNNGVKINSSGTSSALSTGTASAVVAIDVVGVKESGGLLRNLSVYPNPASNQVSLQNTSGFSVAYSIVDVLGREVLKGEFIGIKTLDVSSLGQGAYFIKFESAGISVHKKLVIEKR